jgi:lipopolysaccharide/colanic/teichoic acid biosynthesis glycosyltransferase
MTKRLLDITLASLGLVVLSPVLAALAGAILATMGRPVIFRQTRAGYQGRPFTLYKFRTMRQPVPGEPDVADERRLTRLGRYLRSTSLDELPELINVLRGDMSLVGPRPLLMRYLERYTPEQARRHAVRPGITGWAQVHGRNALTWEEKFEYDVWYVERRSFWLDVRILALTVWTVLKREGISQPGHATAQEFMGYGHGCES